MARQHHHLRKWLPKKQKEKSSTLAKNTKPTKSTTPARNTAQTSADSTTSPQQTKSALSKSTRAAPSKSNKPEKYVDCNCLFCNEKYSESRESWIQCCECELWRIMRVPTFLKIFL